MGKFKISCNEATTICDKNQYGEATFLEKVKLNFHFIYCKCCRTYTKHNNILSKILGTYTESEKNKEGRCMCSKDKEKMENEIKKRLE